MTAKVKTIMKWVVLVLLFGYLGWVTVWAHNEASRHVCKSIAVNVEAPAPIDTIVRNGVIDELQKYPGKIYGIPIDQIDARSIEKFLGRQNSFESVNCVVTASGELQVHVVPMIPVMRVFAGNKSFYINKDGKHIQSNAEFFSDVTVVSGNFKHGFQPIHVLPLVRFVQSDPMMQEITSMIVAQDKYNLLIVPKITGHVVNFGDTTRLAEKRDALKLFYRSVMPHKGWEQYDTISVKFRGQVVATRRDKTHLNVTEDPVEEIDMEEATLPGADELQPNSTPPAAQPSPTKNSSKPAV